MEERLLTQLMTEGMKLQEASDRERGVWPWLLGGRRDPRGGAQAVGCKRAVWGLSVTGLSSQ